MLPVHALRVSQLEFKCDVAAFKQYPALNTPTNLSVAVAWLSCCFVVSQPFPLCFPSCVFQITICLGAIKWRIFPPGPGMMHPLLTTDKADSSSSGNTTLSQCLITVFAWSTTCDISRYLKRNDRFPVVCLEILISYLLDNKPNKASKTDKYPHAIFSVWQRQSCTAKFYLASICFCPLTFLSQHIQWSAQINSGVITLNRVTDFPIFTKHRLRNQEIRNDTLVRSWWKLSSDQSNTDWKAEKTELAIDRSAR